MTRGYFFRAEVDVKDPNHQVEIEVYNEGDNTAEITIFNGTQALYVEADRKHLKELILALEAARKKLPKKR